MTSSWSGPTPARVLGSIGGTADLEQGWDSYGGERVQLDTRVHAKQFICALFELAHTLGLHVSEPAVAPASDGSVAFVWASPHDDRDVEIFIREGYVEAVESQGDDIRALAAESDEVPWALDLLHRSSFVR